MPPRAESKPAPWDRRHAPSPAACGATFAYSFVATAIIAFILEKTIGFVAVLAGWITVLAGQTAEAERWAAIAETASFHLVPLDGSASFDSVMLFRDRPVTSSTCDCTVTPSTKSLIPSIARSRGSSGRCRCPIPSRNRQQSLVLRTHMLIGYVQQDIFLFAGDIAFIGSTPLVWEGSLLNWIERKIRRRRAGRRRGGTSQRSS